MAFISLFLVLNLGVSVGADTLSVRMEKVLKSYSVPREHLGLAVFEIGGAPHRLEFAVNEQKDLIPASVTKIVTAAAALQALGPSFKFQTTLWSTGEIKNGTLEGDLILKGGGDPGFISESMWYLVNELLRTGIRKIDGGILVDDTDFDSIRADPSRDPERVDRAYDAPVGAMSFNWNSINVFVRPGQVGQPPTVYLDPQAAGYTVDNKAKTVNSSGSDIEISRNGERVQVRGTIGIGADEVVKYKNIDDPVDWSGRNLQFFLEQRGIKVSGKIKSGKRPASAKLLAKADSKPLSHHIADMMKFSNNYVAEMLTKNLAAQGGTAPATLEAGMKVIRANLVGLGIAESRFNLVNPSGLSRRNKLKAVDLAQVLVRSSEQFPTFAEMLSAFPLAGIDGTLKNRMKNTPAQGWVRAKTGLLTGVVALAGYAGRKDGSVRAFTFIFNGKPDQGDLVRQLFDRLAVQLVQ